MLKQSIAGIRPGNSDCKQRLLSGKPPVYYRTAFHQTAVFCGEAAMTITIWHVSTAYFQNSVTMQQYSPEGQRWQSPSEACPQHISKTAFHRSVMFMWFDRGIAVRLITKFEAVDWNQRCLHACTWSWLGIEVSLLTAVYISEALMNIYYGPKYS